MKHRFLMPKGIISSFASRRESLRISLILFLTTVLVVPACSPQPKPTLIDSITLVPVSTNTASPTTTPTITPSATITITPQPTSSSTPTIFPTPISGQTAADQFLKKGNRALETGNYEEAIDCYNKTLISYPWLLEAYYGLRAARNNLTLHQSLVKLDEEIVQLDKAITQDSKDYQLYYQRGVTKLKKILISGEPSIKETIEYKNVTVIGDLPVLVHVDMRGAISDFNRAIQINSQYAEAYHMRGLAYHLESLTYSGGFALARINEGGIRKAIRDYEKALKYDPELATAYHDIGAAHAHLARDIQNINQKEQFQEIEQAIEGYSKAINIDPQMTRTYLNRALMIYYYYSLFDHQKESDEEKETMLQLGINDATKVIETESWNPWAYVLRSGLYELLSENVKKVNNLTNLGELAEEDYKIAEDLGHFSFLQYAAVDWFSRLTTLSIGPSIFPEGYEIVGYEYTSPDLGFRLKIPNLMSPNATMFAEQGGSGDFLLIFSDDLGRWYSLQVHPGSLGNQGLEEWVQKNPAQTLEIGKVIKIESKNGEAVEFLYRDQQRKADCGSIVQYHNQRFYTATYCLKDVDDVFYNFRNFAKYYQIQFNPVKTILEEYLKNLDILSE